MHDIFYFFAAALFVSALRWLFTRWLTHDLAEGSHYILFRRWRSNRRVFQQRSLSYGFGRGSGGLRNSRS